MKQRTEDKLAQHVAVIMDGNGRWAQANGLTRAEGHEEGARVAAKTVLWCHERGVEHLTLYAFSQANYRRPADEVQHLMGLCGHFVTVNCDAWVEHGIRLSMIGELEDLPTDTRRAVERALHRTKDGRGMTLCLAIGYGGRSDLLGAVRALSARAHAGLLLPEEIDEPLLRSFMTTGPQRDPDLVIRTGGERRLSDFLLFESAYAELFFSDAMWPQFDEALLDEALSAFARRQRRFGRTDQQLSSSA